MKLRALLLPLAALALLVPAGVAQAASPQLIRGPQGTITVRACLTQGLMAGGCVSRADARYRYPRVPDVYRGFAVRVNIRCDRAGEGFTVRLVFPRATEPDSGRTFSACDTDTITQEDIDLEQTMVDLGLGSGLPSTHIDLTGTIAPWSIRAARSPWVLIINGKRVARGVLSIRRIADVPFTSRRIWDTNFDDYVNVCINGSHQVWASGGRLYCEVSRGPLRIFRYTLSQPVVMGTAT